MADKTKAQLITLVQEVVEAHDDALTFAESTFQAQYNLISNAIKAGDDRPWDDEMLRALRKTRDKVNELYNAQKALVATLNKPLGFYAASNDIDDPGVNMQAFHAKLIADSENFEKRGYTKLSRGVIAGSNTGDPTVAYLLTDTEGDVHDGGRPETYKLRCSRDAVNGALTEGREEYTLSGTNKGAFPWNEAGIGADGGYTRRHGKGTSDISSAIAGISAGGKIKGVGASEAAGNILLNADYTSAWGTGDTKIPEFTFDSGEATVTEKVASTNSAVNINNDGVNTEPIATADFLLRQTIDQGIVSKGAFAYDAYVMGNAGAADLTGDLIMRLIDANGTTHATKTLDLSTLTLATATKFGFKAFLLTANIVGALYFEIELDTLGGTSPNVSWNYVKLAPLTLIDENFFVNILEGLTAARVDDSFTMAVTSVDGGKNQRALNRSMDGNYVKADTAAVDWTDHA